ncbi:MAG: ATP-binding protein [Actinomycetota bacterium]|nr:ATP-binding protein [Actinomycetota bacterium]
MTNGEVWLIVGAQGAGKSTTADLLARTFARGVHLRGGQFYRWAVRGWRHIGEHPDDPVARTHLLLRYRPSAVAADEYCRAGFTTVVQDNIFGQDVVDWLDLVQTRPRHLVVLRPAVQVVRERDRIRQAESGKVAYREGESTVDQLDAALGRTPRIGLWLDTSEQTPDESVAEIVARQRESLVR